MFNMQSIKGDMLFHDDRLDVVPYLNKDTKQLDLMITELDADRRSYTLSSMTSTRTNASVRIGTDISDYIPTQDIVGDAMMKHANTDRYSSVYLVKTCLILEVMQTEDDRVRAIYLEDSPLPHLVISSASQGEDIYNALEPGTLLTHDIFDAGLTELRVQEKISGNLAKVGSWANVAEMKRASHKKDQERRAKVNEFKRAYVEDVQNGIVTEGYANLFKFDAKKQSLVYSDTEIVIESETLYMRLIKALVFRASLNSDFDWYITEIMKELKNLANYGHESGYVMVNGTKVTVEYRLSKARTDLLYINNCRINQDDFFDVTSAVTCYPNSQEMYDLYVKQISQMSLKFHKLAKKGFPMNISRMGFRSLGEIGSDHHDWASEKDEPMAFTQEFRDKVYEYTEIGFNNNIPSVWFPFRKNRGKKGELFFLGKWRKLRDFDYLNIRRYRFSGESGEGHGNQPKKVKTVSLMNDDDKKHPDYRQVSTFLTHLLELDLAFMPEDQFLVPLLRSGQGTQRQPYLTYGVLSCPRANIEKITQLVVDVCALFEESLQKAYETIRRSELFLEDVVKTIGAQVIESDRGVVDYKVQGLSGTVYLVGKKSCKVRDMNGNHICIVRARSDADEGVGYDYLASLLMTLRHDKMTVKDIHTLKRYVKSEKKGVSISA